MVAEWCRGRCRLEDQTNNHRIDDWLSCGRRAHAVTASLDLNQSKAECIDNKRYGAAWPYAINESDSALSHSHIMIYSLLMNYK